MSLTSPIDIISEQAIGFAREVKRRSGENIEHCYQCGKCMAGCPIAFAMDIDPARLMRLVQLGQKETVLKSHAIWLCVSCYTCTTRCPHEVDLAKVMDTLKAMAVKEGFVTERDVVTFYKAFLDNVKRYGRVFEFGLVTQYNLKSGHWFHDADKAPILMAKGKLPLLPPRVKGAENIRRMFEKLEEGKI